MYAKSHIILVENYYKIIFFKQCGINLFDYLCML